MIGAAPLTPYLGPIVDAGGGKRPKQISNAYAIVDQLRDQLGPFDVCKFQLRTDQGPWYPLIEHGFKTEARQTYVLDQLDPDVVWKGFSTRARGAIRKAEKAVLVKEEHDSQTLWAMLSATFERQGRSVPYSSDLLSRVVDAAIEHGQGRVIVARDSSGRPHAANFSVWDDQRTYYLVGGADTEVRDSGAVALLVWDALQFAERHSTAFDFEGSMVPGIERFFAGFGGRPETYLAMTAFSHTGRAAWTTGKAVRAASHRISAWRSARS